MHSISSARNSRKHGLITRIRSWINPLPFPAIVREIARTGEGRMSIAVGYFEGRSAQKTIWRSTCRSVRLQRDSLAEFL